MDLLEYVSQTAGLDYLSDLRRPGCWNKVRHVIAQADEGAFPLRDWDELAAYLMGDRVEYPGVPDARRKLLEYLTPLASHGRT